MPALDERGKIAAAQLAFYVPIAIISLLFFIRYLFSNDGGWFMLLIFALIRIVGGALIVAGESMTDPSIDLFIAAYLLFHAGLAILMLASIGFISLAGYRSYSDYYSVRRLYFFAGGLALVTLGLSIAAGLLGTHVNPDVTTGLILRRVSAGVYGALYLVLVFMTMVAWSHRYAMRSYRRKLLAGVTLALPFLGARVAYEFLASWSSSDPFGNELSSNPTLAKFNPVQGDWIPYLVMGLVVEFVAALIYAVFGAMLHRRHP
ncbi:hypothetical protein BDZ89DRAFT_1069904 [Hymenopellis radicata]|nr:hypothetical protein BDZ89DRAFT_1069904 [Hymenopellis radicata]